MRKKVIQFPRKDTPAPTANQIKLHLGSQSYALELDVTTEAKPLRPTPEVAPGGLVELPRRIKIGARGH
jgi:hypothetical protein